jgi:hypothetical protein
MYGLSYLDDKPAGSINAPIKTRALDRVVHSEQANMKPLDVGK